MENRKKETERQDGGKKQKKEGRNEEQNYERKLRKNGREKRMKYPLKAGEKNMGVLEARKWRGKITISKTH